MEAKEKLSGEDTLKAVIAETGKCMLSFSAGKDSIGAWLKLRGRIEVSACYMYLVPGLEFVEESLAYYEKFFGQRIVRVPNPHLYRMLNNGVFQTPERVEVIHDCQMPDFNFDFLRDYVAEKDFGLPKRTWLASGVRESDNLARRCAINMLSGGLNRNRNIFYPVWDWNNARLEAEIMSAGVKLPVDYAMFGRSFDGLDFRYLGPIRKYFPRDYAKILEWFPLCEMEFYRHANPTK